MMIHEITDKVGRYKPAKRLGRGEASGQGGTSGRGHKGAKSRSGWKQRDYYEGGQMPLIRRVPKRGFSNAPFRTRYDIVNLAVIEKRFQDGERVDLAILVERGVLKSRHGRLKVLGEGELTRKLTIQAASISESARKKVEAAGGAIEITGGETPAKKNR